MKKEKDLTGQKFGRLTVIELDHKQQRNDTKYFRKYLKCICDCGNIHVVQDSHLKSGKISSCGCLRKELSTKRATKKTAKSIYKTNRLYSVYSDMKTRCYNKNAKNYPNYGGRGIKICDEWLNDFSSFELWACQTGYDENAKRGECTIDRIDVNGNYEPSNCRWVTIQKQANNRRSNIVFTYNSKTQTLTEWARELNVHYSRLVRRYKKGWSVEKIFESIIQKTEDETKVR